MQPKNMSFRLKVLKYVYILWVLIVIREITFFKPKNIRISNIFKQNLKVFIIFFIYMVCNQYLKVFRIFSLYMLKL